MNFRQHKEKLLKNLKVQTEYEKLGPEFQLAQSLIRARLKKGWTRPSSHGGSPCNSPTSRAERAPANSSPSAIRHRG